MKKKYILLIILLISFFVSFHNIDSIRFMMGMYLPTKTKVLIKELFFGKETIEKFRKYKEYGKMNFNQTLLPETQFTNINFKEISLHGLNFGKGSSYNKLINQSLSIKFFIEQFNDDLIAVDLKGKVFFINMQFITDLKNFNWIQVNSNLDSQDIKIKDVLILNNEIYISYAEFGSEAKNCQTINISKAKISEKKLNFEIFFKSKACENLFNAGRMVFYNLDGKEGLLVTTGAVGIKKNLAQDDNSPFGKILFIDFETNNYTIFSKGHREPQGLTIEGKFILSAEHGPRGGDEINLIQFGQNYGWPISSYGEPYLDLEKSSKVYDYLKNHSDHGFIEPIYSFVPSIGINQIIKVPDDFSEYWKNNFLVTSLGGKTIYRILFDKNFTKIIFHEKIYIGKRIRDIIYSKKFNVFLLALEGQGTSKTDRAPSIGILSNSFD